MDLFKEIIMMCTNNLKLLIKTLMIKLLNLIGQAFHNNNTLHQARYKIQHNNHQQQILKNINLIPRKSLTQCNRLHKV